MGHCRLKTNQVVQGGREGENPPSFACPFSFDLISYLPWGTFLDSLPVGKRMKKRLCLFTFLPEISTLFEAY